MHATVVPVDIHSLQIIIITCNVCSWVKLMNIFFPLVPCLAPSSTMTANQ